MAAAACKIRFLQRGAIGRRAKTAHHRPSLMDGNEKRGQGSFQAKGRFLRANTIIDVMP